MEINRELTLDPVNLVHHVDENKLSLLGSYMGSVM